MTKVKEMMRWVRTVLQSSYKIRLKLAREIEEDVRKWGSLEDRETREGQMIVDQVCRSKDFELFGIVPNLPYLRVSGEEEDREAVFVHAFGDPVLLYRHRETGMLAIIGASLHFDESLVEKVPYNKAKGYFQGPKRGLIG